MPDTTDKPEPSDLVKASPFLMGKWTFGFLAPEEIERRALGAQRLSKAFSSIPSHARRAKANPDYWNELYASRANW